MNILRKIITKIFPEYKALEFPYILTGPVFYGNVAKFGNKFWLNIEEGFFDEVDKVIAHEMQKLKNRIAVAPNKQKRTADEITIFVYKDMTTKPGCKFSSEMIVFSLKEFDNERNR